jgi:hypothetical protein
MTGKRERENRRRAASGTPAAAGRSDSAKTVERPRRDEGLRQARIAKAAVGVIAVLVAAVVMALARVTYAGHAKHATPPLAIPQPLYEVVRHNLLQAGILAPATASAAVVTGSS